MTQPVELPASGDVDYTYEIVPTHFGKTAGANAEVLPSARANVHHAVVYIRPPNSIGCAMRRWAGVHGRDADERKTGGEALDGQ